MVDKLKRTHWNFFSGSRLTFGSGATRVLSAIANRESKKRVFVISDATLKEHGVLESVEATLNQSSAEWILSTEGCVEPSTGTVKQVVDQAREFKPDLFVAVGGGSNMDLAKATAAAYQHNCDCEALFGFDQVPGAIAPLVCLPTTAGTGSEVSHAAIVLNESSGQKSAILSQHIRPETAIVDPRLSITCPPKVTAESGLDALTHAIEAFMVTNFYLFEDDSVHGLPYEGNHPFGDMYAEKAISLIADNLQTAVGKPQSLAARSGMALAATLAGAAFSSCGVSLCHALEYPIGGKYKCSHGIGNALVLPSVMRYWLPTRTSRLAKIAALLGVQDAERMPVEEAAEAAIGKVESLRSAVGLPTSLAEVGVSMDDIDLLAESATALQRLLDLSPRSATQEDLKQILSAAF